VHDLTNSRSRDILAAFSSQEEREEIRIDENDCYSLCKSRIKTNVCKRSRCFRSSRKTKSCRTSSAMLFYFSVSSVELSRKRYRGMAPLPAWPTGCWLS